MEDGFPISVKCDPRLTLGDNWDTKLGHQLDFYCRMALDIKDFFGLLSPPVGVTTYTYSVGYLPNNAICRLISRQVIQNGGP